MNKRNVALVAILALAVLVAAVSYYYLVQPGQGTNVGENRTYLNLVLEVYGNADMNDIIDEGDVLYVQKIIRGEANATQFADSNKDGTINESDIVQIRSIINGNASFIVLLDGKGKVMNLSLPKNRIVVEYLQNAELVRILGIEDRVVGVDYAVEQLKRFYFPENGDNITFIGNMYNPDYELVLSVHPDIVLTFSKDTETKAANLPGVDVVYLGLYYPNVTSPETSSFIQGILKAGYIFNKVDRSREYADWILNLTRSVGSVSSNITGEQRKTVFITNYPYTWSTTVTAYCAVDTLGQACILAGGENVAELLPNFANSSSLKVDLEWLIQSDPEYIFIHTVRYTYSGIKYADPAHGYDVNDTSSISSCLNGWTSHAEFTGLRAVRDGHVYIMAGDFRNNAMGGTLGAAYMAKILYPELFTELDPEAIHQEYVTRFLRLDVDLDESGVFLYPPINVGNNTAGVPEK